MSGTAYDRVQQDGNGSWSVDSSRECQSDEPSLTRSRSLSSTLSATMARMPSIDDISQRLDRARRGLDAKEQHAIKLKVRKALDASRGHGTKTDELYSELARLRPKMLKARAKAEGADDAQLEALDDAHHVKAAAIELIVQLVEGKDPPAGAHQPSRILTLLDVDCGASIPVAEIRAFIQQLDGVQHLATKEQVTWLVEETLDRNGDGEIDLDEFKKWFDEEVESPLWFEEDFSVCGCGIFPISMAALDRPWIVYVVTTLLVLAPLVKNANDLLSYWANLEYAECVARVSIDVKSCKAVALSRVGCAVSLTKALSFRPLPWDLLLLQYFPVPLCKSPSSCEERFEARRQRGWLTGAASEANLPLPNEA